MDGAHTHGPSPTGFGELVAVGAGIALAAIIVARALACLLIVVAIVGSVLALGLIGYVVAACRRYQQAIALEVAQHLWPVVPEDLPRAVSADPVPLRQAITELQAQLLAARTSLPPVDSSRHQHLHFHGLTPGQAAAIIAQLQAQQHPGRWKDGGSP